MATSTLIQYLESGVGAETSNRTQVETFIAAAAIAEGDVVSLDNAQAVTGDKALFVKKADAGSTDLVCPVGVALAAAAAGAKVDVVVRGLASANCLAHTKGDVLTVTATAGSMDTIAAATSPQVAVSLQTLAAPGKALVFVRGAF